ncbi:hypothetical protein F4860DRAFT_510863 [Xylaria cubensis]|nr:hypothetical protein F4860DRAFT_510863 [Xylaria cubensis]
MALLHGPTFKGLERVITASISWKQENPLQTDLKMALLHGPAKIKGLERVITAKYFLEAGESFADRPEDDPVTRTGENQRPGTGNNKKWYKDNRKVFPGSKRILCRQT